EAWGQFRDHPLLGIGTGGFGTVDPQLYPHNIVLEAAAELGFPGLVLVLGILAYGVRAVLRALRGSEGEEKRRAALIAALFLAALLNALVSGDLPNNSAVWLATGL